MCIRVPIEKGPLHLLQGLVWPGDCSAHPVVEGVLVYLKQNLKILLPHFGSNKPFTQIDAIPVDWELKGMPPISQEGDRPKPSFSTFPFPVRPAH